MSGRALAKKPTKSRRAPVVRWPTATTRFRRPFRSSEPLRGRPQRPKSTVHGLHVRELLPQELRILADNARRGISSGELPGRERVLGKHLVGGASSVPQVQEESIAIVGAAVDVGGGGTCVVITAIVAVPAVAAAAEPPMLSPSPPPPPSSSSSSSVCQSAMKRKCRSRVALDIDRQTSV